MVPDLALSTPFISSTTEEYLMIEYLIVTLVHLIMDSHELSLLVLLALAHHLLYSIYVRYRKPCG